MNGFKLSKLRIVMIALMILAALCGLALNHASAANQTEPGQEAMMIPYWVGPVDKAEANPHPYAVTCQETPVYSSPDRSEENYLFSIPAHKIITVQRELDGWFESIPAHWVQKTDLCLYK